MQERKSADFSEHFFIMTDQDYVTKLIPKMRSIDFSELILLAMDKFKKEKTHVRVIKYLLKSGVDPNYKSKSGITALMKAVRKNEKETVALLIEAGADVNARNKNWFKKTALEINKYEVIAATFSKNGIKIRQMLVKAGAIE